MNDIFQTPNETCFAYKVGINGKYGCQVLNVEKCPGKSCSSYKTKEQCYQQNLKCIERIRALPKIQQEHIRDKYGVEI